MYDEPVFRLVKKPGTWVHISPRARNTTFFRRRYGPFGFRFTGRGSGKDSGMWGMYEGPGIPFDREKFYHSLRPFGSAGRRAP